MKAGFLVNVRALWIGAHYSSAKRRLCVNLVPCLTVWLVFRGGKAPEQADR